MLDGSDATQWSEPVPELRRGVNDTVFGDPITGAPGTVTVVELTANADGDRRYVVFACGSPVVERIRARDWKQFTPTAASPSAGVSK